MGLFTIPKFKYLIINIVWFLLLINNSNSANATTYFVDNINGQNTNDGLTTSSAWLTLAKASTIASAGDTVNVINNGPLYPFRERLAPSRSGNSGNHLRFAGYNGSPVLIGTVDYSHNVSSGWLWKPSSTSGEYYLTKNNGDPGISAVLPRVLATSLASSWTSSGVDSLNHRTTGTIGSLGAGQWNWGNNDSLGYNTIYYRLASGESDITTTHIEAGEDSAQRRNPILVAWEYIDIENFKVRYSNHSGILNQTLSNYVTYNNVDSSYTGRAGLGIGIFNHLTVTNSRFDHNGILSNVKADYTGIQLSGTTSSTITNNVISNGYNDSGINVKASSSNNLITNNIVFNNAQHGIDISTSSQNNTVYNNTVYGNAENGINIETNSTGAVVKNNIIANNTAYQLSVFDAGSTSGFISNYNSIYSSNSSSSTIRYVGNFYSLDNFASYQTFSNQDANSIKTNPVFTNGSSNFSLTSDYKLQPNSPLINSGLSVGISSDYINTSIPQGNSPDIGAYEYFIPNLPTSLSQYLADGVTTISNGGQIDDTTVILKFNLGSSNPSDIFTPQFEIRENTVGFQNVATDTGTTIAYSGSPIVGQVTITNLERGKSYHWQARISNPAGNSNWVSLGNSPDFTINYLPSPTPTPSLSPTTTPTPTTIISFIPNSQNYVSINSPKSCNDIQPISIPNLFQIDINDTVAKIFFTPIPNNDDYYISFSTNPSAEENGVNVKLMREGVQNFTINLLKPNSIYYFKVRGQNGCNPGQWSNIFVAKTKIKGQTRKVSTFKKTTLYKLSPSVFAKKNIIIPSIPILIPTPSEMVLTPIPTSKPINQQPQKKCILWGLICY